jgi:carbon monoxide dehydrogenase subunit G
VKTRVLHRMELNGDVLVAAPRDQVWNALNDTAVLARCIPGCEEMEALGETERRARVAVKVGPVRARFTGHVRLLDVRPGEGCTLQFEGSGGAAGMARGQSTLQLSDDPEGTRVSYTAQATVGGKLGQVGGRLIDAAAMQMADQFFQALRREFQPPAAELAAPAPAVDAAPAAPEAAALPAPGPAAAAVPAALAAPSTTPASEGVRVLWFAMGVLSTAIGVWLGATLFG